LTSKEAGLGPNLGTEQRWQKKQELGVHEYVGYGVRCYKLNYTTDIDTYFIHRFEVFQQWLVRASDKVKNGDEFHLFGL